MSGLAFFGTRQDDGEDPSRKIETGRDFFSQEEIATRPLFRDSRLEDFESRILLVREPFFLTAINPTKTNTHFTELDPTGADTSSARMEVIFPGHFPRLLCYLACFGKRKEVEKQNCWLSP